MTSAAPAQPVTRRSVGLRSERGPILGSLMLAAALVALDATILATAAQTIARELGDFERLPWVFSVYMLAQAVSVPVYGRLADVLGRKRVMLAGIGLFLLGSVLCGLAPSMTWLIIGRVVQGLGAGAVMPMSMTIVSDVYTLAERAKTQGYLASVWAMSSVVGPTLGGVFSQFASWRWIFWINVPLSLLAAVMLWRSFHESAREGRREPIDYVGAALLTAGSTALLLALLEGASLPVALTAGLVALAVLALGGFAWWALRSAHPVFDLRVLRRRVIGSSTGAALMVGVIVLGLSTYIPIYAQGVLGVGPLVAGFALAAMMLGWPLTATWSGSFYLRIGFRATGLIGSSLVTAGSLFAVFLLGEDSAVWQVAATTFFIGAGMGLTAVPTLIAAQTSAPWHERGAVTGINMFSRSIGSAVGVAVFGAIVNAHAQVGADGTPEGPGLADAMHLVFIATTACAALMFVAVALMPKDRPAPAGV
ncbi:MDR family MFS transporter [Myceligenerans xiligouense]|uniref:EmrB/QacA subfamily drug resistance transporter n=1 Tax=Myceligenerans xiligouense TaxID=253184 RepID=A0A3N4Z421_9MICO|nr:MDR family MFS transporter [Myceligenerans xiligouense]RPF20678.1 EmrB/QacA subfamily drug resistance transporter [Myceligenerans xiligouense]